MAHQSIALVTRHEISSPDARTTTRGDRAATPAERSAAYRARRKATAADMPAKPPVVIRYRWPADRRSRPQQWADAVQTLADLLDQFEAWRDKLRPASRTAQRRKRSMPCWNCAVMSKIFRPSSCQKALDGTDDGSTQRTIRSSINWGSALCPRPKPSIRKGWHLDVPSAVIAKRAARESARLPGLSRLGRVPA